MPEGPHRVALAVRDLPADIDPGPAANAQVLVQPRRIARADLDVFRLSAAHGQIVGPDKAPLADILVRLLPTTRYTTTDGEGHFAFYNLREGDYQVVLDTATLPPDAAPSSPERLALAVRHGVEPSPLCFEFVIRKIEKPIRKVLIQ